MATKKKTRKIKKDKGNKKIMQIDFSTPKNKFANNIIVFQQKNKLYEINTIETIEAEMKKYDIYLSKDEILNKYEKTFNIDNLVNEYNGLFEKQLDQLANLNKLFDDDCILFYINKIVYEYKRSHDVPDPDFIAEDLGHLSILPNKKKFNGLLKQLKLLNQLKDFTEQKNINKIFEGTILDVEWTLSDLIGIDMQNYKLDLSKTKELTAEVFTFIDTYELENPEYLYGDALSLMARHGYLAVKDKFEEGLDKYPNNQLRMYNSILIELEFINDTNLPKLYQEAINLTPKSSDDKDNLDLIHENLDDNFANTNQVLA